MMKIVTVMLDQPILMQVVMALMLVQLLTNKMLLNGNAR
jgi:hypothetical protein